MKNVYFLSDAHLGSLAIPHARMQERRLVRFLDSIKEKAAAIYLLGDMFDFWYEYKNVVPKGFTRFLGKLSELTDLGVEVNFFTGNHDIWAYEYLEKECGVILHKKPITTEIYGHEFFLAHGDGLGDPDASFKLLRAIFHNKVCQWLSRLCIHVGESASDYNGQSIATSSIRSATMWCIWAKIKSTWCVMRASI